MMKMNNQKFFFKYFNIFIYIFYIYNFSILLNASFLKNFCKNKNLFILLFSKKNIFKLNWMKNKRYLYKTKKFFNFSLKFKTKKNFKKKTINKIIKSKRLTGLFKRKLNIRKTVLRKRSLLFLFLETKKNKIKFLNRKKKKELFLKKKWKNRKIININLKNHVKSIFFENRKIFSCFLKNKKLKKQNKFSKYVINHLNKTSKTLLHSFEFKLAHILIKSHFFDNLSDSSFFIKNGHVIVNNILVRNPNLILNFNDLIRLNNKFNYYFFYRKNLNNSLKMSKKINWAFYKFIKKQKFNKFFPKVYNWINSSIYFGFDIPFYLEVDFINMSIVILIKSLDFKNVSRPNIKYINFYLTRLYNWNYIV